MRLGVALLCLFSTFLAPGCSKRSPDTVSPARSPGSNVTPADQPPSSLAATVCARGCDFTQIQQALQASPPGATITVSAGTYRENLVIEKAVVLRGAGLDQTRIESAKGGPVILAATPAETAVALERLTIAGGARGGASGCIPQPEQCNNGVVLRGRVKATLSRVRLSANADNGLALRDWAEATVEDSEISRNQGGGASLGDAAKLTVRNSVVSNNPGRSIIAAGIRANDEAQLVLDAVTMSGNSWSGVWALGSARVDIRNSVIKDTTGGLDQGSGVVADQRAEVRMDNSVIENNGTDTRCLGRQWPSEGCQGVLAIGQSRVLIKDSTIRGNTDWGVALWRRQCGYTKDLSIAEVMLEGNIVIEGNMRSANYAGQVCLPSLERGALVTR